MRLRTLLIAGCLSGVVHLWITRATVWELLNSHLQFVVWPGLLAATAIQAVLPGSITVQNDPLPHPFVMLAGLVFNVVAWAAIFFGIGTVAGRVMRRGNVDQHGI